jgi:hypothetical protein
MDTSRHLASTVTETKNCEEAGRNNNQLVVKSSKTRRSFIGWRFGVGSSSAIVLVVLILNTSFTLWTYAQRGFSDGRGVLCEGDCANVRKLNITTHLIINILSTAILSGSNYYYCMQCCSAPTRSEVDRAHAQGHWLDIGVPSIKNLGRAAYKRTFIWWCLGISSFPLHLLYDPMSPLSRSTD